MNAQVSTNYRRLRPDEVAEVAARCEHAWQNPELPMRQYEIVKPELEAMRTGVFCAPFDTLVKCLRTLPAEFLSSKPRLLDVGASSGYYSELIKWAGFDVRYQGCDYSEAFKDLALKLYAGIEFDFADARQLPYPDDSFDIVLSSGTIMHVAQYKRVISECARVAKQYAVFHRTPVNMAGPTQFYVKTAYDVPVFEVHFSERELMGLCQSNGLELQYAHPVFWEPGKSSGHMTYLFSKTVAGERQWESA